MDLGTAIIVMFAVARNWDLGRYAKLRRTGMSDEDIIAWELRYVVGASPMFRSWGSGAS